MTNPFGGERSCSSPLLQEPARFIVLTGGPGAGKTAVLEILRKLLCERTAILPEAASIIYGGGFWRLRSMSAQMAAQVAIFHTQVEMERLVSGEQRWNAALCDRGSLDGLAYWPGEEADYWRTLRTTRADQMRRYHAVIHLRCPSDSGGYNHSNPLRVESAEEAAFIDERIANIWSAHPGYREIKNTKTFLEKAEEAIHLIAGVLPPACRDELTTGVDDEKDKNLHFVRGFDVGFLRGKRA